MQAVEFIIRSAAESAKHAKACRRQDTFETIYNACVVGQQTTKIEIVDSDLLDEIQLLGYKVYHINENNYSVCW